MRPVIPVTFCCILGAPAYAADLDVTVEIPRLQVAEYHRPYVAVWIEKPDHEVAATLAVWYDTETKNGEGTTWLKDLRQWWRRAGRELEMPVDGVSGATRPAGEHKVGPGNGRAIQGLPPGEYSLVVEAAREVGGRELVRIPFQWPPGATDTLAASGEFELGAVKLELVP